MSSGVIGRGDEIRTYRGVMKEGFKKVEDVLAVVWGDYV